jgi:hypothetical protein
MSQDDEDDETYQPVDADYSDDICDVNHTIAVDANDGYDEVHANDGNSVNAADDDMSIVTTRPIPSPNLRRMSRPTLTLTDNAARIPGVNDIEHNVDKSSADKQKKMGSRSVNS